MEQWTIRPCREADRGAVIGLWRDCGLTRPWNDPDRDFERKMADSPELFFLALDEAGEPAGTCMAGYEGHRGWIFYMGVHPDRRGRGLAAALLGHAEEALRALGCPKVELMVREDNAAVQAFYRRLGYADEPVVVLGKRLVRDD